MFEIREIKINSKYNPLLISKNAPLTQAWFFGEWQEIVGRKVRRFGITKDSETTGFFQIIKYPLIFSKNFLYIPHGPILKENIGGDFLKEFRQKLTDVAKEETAVFAIFDPFPKIEKNFDKYFKKTPVSRYHSSYFQPKYEWILNLEKPEEEILSEMHPKTRYNIHLAAKKGVKIEITPENFDKYFYDFYKLLEETANRDNFNLHPKIYYQNIFGKCDENKSAFLAVARYGGKILAINLILLFGNTAYFMFGGSSGEYKNLMAPSLAHWEAIREVKNRGFEIYNFGAINNENFSAKGGPASGWEGISRFKKGFGGKIFEYSDSYDLVLKPFWHRLYNIKKRFL